MSADTVGPADACQESACHSGGVPCVASLDALHRSVSEFVVTDLDLVIEPSALAAARRRSLDSSGLLLLGEAHGVRENPLLIRALMKAFGLTSLALEWPDDLAPVIQTFLAGKTLADHPWLVQIASFPAPVAVTGFTLIAVTLFQSLRRHRRARARHRHGSGTLHGAQR